MRENYDWMLRLSERILRHKSLAEDAVQDALISATKDMERFEGRSSLKTWLHGSP